MRGYAAKDAIVQLFGLSGRRIEQLVADGVIDRVHIEGDSVCFELAATIQSSITSGCAEGGRCFQSVAPDQSDDIWCSRSRHCIFYQP